MTVDDKVEGDAYRVMVSTTSRLWWGSTEAAM